MTRHAQASLDMWRESAASSARQNCKRRRTKVTIARNCKAFSSVDTDDKPVRAERSYGHRGNPARSPRLRRPQALAGFGVDRTSGRRHRPLPMFNSYTAYSTCRGVVPHHPYYRRWLRTESGRCCILKSTCVKGASNGYDGRVLPNSGTRIHHRAHSAISGGISMVRSLRDQRVDHRQTYRRRCGRYHTTPYQTPWRITYQVREASTGATGIHEATDTAV